MSVIRVFGVRRSRMYFFFTERGVGFGFFEEAWVRVSVFDNFCRGFCKYFW